MANKKKYPVHADFQHFPAISFPFNSFIVSLLNNYLHFDTFLRQRKVKAKAILHNIPCSDGASIKVYQFNPDQNSKNKPALIYFHGGAFVLTYASTHVQAVDYYANHADCSVFLVDYRLAPKHLFPTGFNDCYDSLCWIKNNAEQLGIDANCIAVGGDSAGGALAAGVAQRSLDENGPAIVGQLLIYPVLDNSCSTRSAREYEGAPLFDAVANKKMWEIYVNASAENFPVYAAPANRENLQGLATTYIENAEFDPLSDEAVEYASRLILAGVTTELHATKGTIHGYDTVLTSAITQESLAKRISFLRRIFKRD